MEKKIPDGVEMHSWEFPHVAGIELQGDKFDRMNPSFGSFCQFVVTEIKKNHPQLKTFKCIGKTERKTCYAFYNHFPSRSIYIIQGNILSLLIQILD